jgi:hypothetical protein
MPGIPAEHAQDVREALRVIVSDPGHGPAALSNSQMMSNLLKDLLPDSPREKNLLVAAAEANLAGMMRDHVNQGIDGPSAVRLAAASFGASTHFTDGACSWVATELAVALGLGRDLGDDRSALPEGEITTARQGDGVAVETRVVSAPTEAIEPPATTARDETTAGRQTRPSVAPAAATAARRAVSASTLVVLAGAVALLVAYDLPVFSNPSAVRIWSGLPFFIVCIPVVAFVVAALSAATMFLLPRSPIWRAVAGTSAAVCGLEMLVFFVALNDKFVSNYGDQRGIGLVIGVLSAVLLVTGGVLELVKQARAK